MRSETLVSFNMFSPETIFLITSYEIKSRLANHERLLDFPYKLSKTIDKLKEKIPSFLSYIRLCHNYSILIKIKTTMLLDDYIPPKWQKFMNKS